MLLSEYYSLCKLFGNVVLFTELSTHYILIVGSTDAMFMTFMLM